MSQVPNAGLDQHAIPVCLNGTDCQKDDKHNSDLLHLIPPLAPNPLARCRCGKRPYGSEFPGIFPPDVMNREGILQIQPELL